MSKFLALAIAKLNIEPDQVLSSRLSEDSLSLVVNYGIAGAKKYSFSFDELLPEIDPIEVEAVKVDQVVERVIKKGRKRG